MSSKNKDIRNGTKLLNLFLDKTLSREQLLMASQIIGREREKYSNREQQDEAAEAKALELVTALKQCRTEKEKKAVLNYERLKEKYKDDKFSLNLIEKWAQEEDTDWKEAEIVLDMF